jgi:hypothetical protein
MEEGKIKRIPISDLKREDGVDELLDSPEMEPYMNLAVATLSGRDVGAALEAIAQLPLEDRYIWRVASALKWGFADYESENVKADKATLSAEDLAKVLDIVRIRPTQMALFLKALVGTEEMQRLMNDAVSAARQVP